MYPVVPLREDDVGLLQPLHPFWNSRVGVGPLVNLVCESDEKAQCVQVTIQGVPALYVAVWLSDKGVEADHKTREGTHTIVTVGFDEVMPGDGNWVDVMLPERPDECL